MKQLLLTILFLCSCNISHAALVTWELQNFSFGDGGTAYGSFVYDTNLNVINYIDVYTTQGSRLNGRHYIATAGAWGSNADSGSIVLTDTASTTNYQGAGWLRMEFTSFRNIEDVGYILNQRIYLGAESYCTNTDCSSAANEITDPANSRETISGYVLLTHSSPSPVPIPASSWLFISGLLSIFHITRRSKWTSKKRLAF